MINVLQRHWVTTVHFDSSTPDGATAAYHADFTGSAEHQQTAGQIQAQTVYCGTDCEVGTRLWVDPISFKIKEAIWENYSPPVAITDVPGMRGLEAYFNCGPAIKALADLGSFARALFAETIRGIIQAETFLFTERGFTSAAEYSKHWEKFYINSCRYFSNLEKVSKSWDEYVYYMRTGNLFNRFKAQSVYAVSGGGYHVVATFSDSFHELSVILDMDNNLVITGVLGTLLRAPDEICREATIFLQHLQGHDASNLGKKQVAALLGKGDGCVHIIDTVCDALMAVNMAAQRHAGAAAI
ncbi:DUF2889 domain-containing protein [Desulfoscipio gibsoniae]|uniref:Uncharacterized protein n=1 Tax=Desulfoscipio gibsoniae DSM 7213 TaxID=767817 RepID=R4KEH4_9FIRM|nr:DUF2889 domain-containing protein [Desulfoscipio gibsoniae]AGL01583.1 Protein of unknown function (DUF2889) [Desulfoscipio gibsoniae DSM 7213]